MACNESSGFQQAISHALQRFATPSMVLKTEQRALSKLSTLPLHFAHLRFGKPSSSFNVISNRAFILDASLSWLAFLPNKCYSMVAISHRESAKAAQRCRVINFVRAHSVNVKNVAMPF